MQSSCFLEKIKGSLRIEVPTSPPKDWWMNIPFDHPKNAKRKQQWLKYHRKCLRNHGGMEKHLENCRNDKQSCRNTLEENLAANRGICSGNLVW
jgi:hypothetical protein